MGAIPRQQFPKDDDATVPRGTIRLCSNISMERDIALVKVVLYNSFEYRGRRKQSLEWHCVPTL